MSITNQQILDTANTVYQGKFDEIFINGAPGEWQRYTESITTDVKINEIDVLEAMPVVREWIGAKQFPDILASNMSATIKPYEKSFKIPRIDVVTDRTGLIGRRISAFLGDNAGMFDKLAFEALIANGVGYDGVAIFSASHPRGPAAGTQSNTTTSALSFATHETALIAGASLRDANSEPLRIAYDTLTVGPKLAKIGKEITGSTERLQLVTAAGVLDPSASGVAASTVPNVFGGGDMSLIIDPRLVGTYDDYYYYTDSTRGPKPVIAFILRQPEGISQTQMDDEGRFLHDELRFSVEADAVFAPGDWHVAYAGIL